MSKRLPATQRGGWLAWGGFVNGRLDVIEVDECLWDHGNHARRPFYAPAVFRSGGEARTRYQDVRRIRIVEEGDHE